MNKITNQKQLLFPNKALFSLIIPLVIESFLGSTMGFVGMIMVASAGEAAVSAVALVDNINNLILFFLAALATGGAIIIAQNLGKGDKNTARDVAKQLLYTTVLFAIMFMVITLIGNRFLLMLIFGEIEAQVMLYAQTYFLITVISYPFIAIINSISATFRSMGISKTPMLVTLLMSVINVVICAVLIYGFHLGVLGAAIAVLTSRAIASVLMILLIRNHHNAVHINHIFRFNLKLKTIKNILKVGIPTGLDSGMFHFGRLIMQSLIATFGTVSIAANAVVGQIFNIVFIPGAAVSMAIITVVGQCVGADDFKQATSYTKKLVGSVYLSKFVLCGTAFLLMAPLLALFNLGPEATALGSTVLTFTLLFSALFHPLAFVLPNALRAAGDIRFTMIVSLLSMWLVRIFLAYVIEHFFRLGLISVWIAMYSDWLVRLVVFTWRFAGGKWKTKKMV